MNKMSNNIAVFDKNTLDYDKWFIEHFNLYQSELLAIKQAIPKNKSGIEIGVGTGRFAQPLNIKVGVEPSDNMARVAKQRGIQVIKAASLIPGANAVRVTMIWQAGSETTTKVHVGLTYGD